MENINTQKQRAYAVGIIDLLVIMFIGLKLSNVIDWSWWLILAGWYVPLAIAGCIHLLLAVASTLDLIARAKHKSK